MIQKSIDSAIEGAYERLYLLPRPAQIAVVATIALVVGWMGFQILGFVLGVVASLATIAAIVIGSGYFAMRVYERIGTEPQSAQAREVRQQLETAMMGMVGATGERLRERHHRYLESVEKPKTEKRVPQNNDRF